jgi:hypothetical protein
MWMSVYDGTWIVFSHGAGTAIGGNLLLDRLQSAQTLSILED